MWKNCAVIWKPGLVLVAGSLAIAELVNARAAASWDRRLEQGASCAIIVLGYPSHRGGKLHPIQKWRTQIAARTLAEAGDGCLIFSGAATRRGAPEEARVMATYAIDQLGVPSSKVLLELKATDTWENLDLSLPQAEAFDFIAIASDPLHAARARRYAARQRPDLESKIVGSADYRFLERWWLKMPIALYEGVVRIRDLRFARSSQR